MMQQLLALRQQKIEPYLQLDLKNASQRMEHQFAFFSANLHNLLPHLPREDYMPVFRQLQTNRVLAFLDIEQAACPGLMQVQGWDAARVAGLRNRPGIICSFHTGPYRYLNYLLAHAGIPLSIVVAGAALKREQAALDTYTQIVRAAGATADLELINAEHPHALFRMARAAKRGRCLFVYIDGNTGAGTANRHPRNLLTIPFCGWPMWVRKGTAAIAHRLGLPLYPITGERCAQNDPNNNHSLTFTHHDPITPLRNEDENTFSEKATTLLYGLLEQVASTQPQQWEGWLNTHLNLVVSGTPPTPDPTENPTFWATFRWGKQAYLLHRPSYWSYTINWKWYRQNFKGYNAEFLKT